MLKALPAMSDVGGGEVDTLTYGVLPPADTKKVQSTWKILKDMWERNVTQIPQDMISKDILTKALPPYCTW